METIKEYAIFFQQENSVNHNGIRLGTLDMLREDFPDAVILPTDEVPENWADMSVENGVLVPAPEEVLQLRRQEEAIREAEDVRSEREARYRSETDPMLFDAMEAYALAHPEEEPFARWLAAKDRIREEVPKPQTREL